MDLSHPSFFGEDNIFGRSKGAWFTMMEDELNLGQPGFEFELVSFQFFQKCPNIDLTLTACLLEIEMKFQYGALAKTVTVTVTP